MAVDTRNKRASVVGLLLPFRRLLPHPDGAALTQGDRQQVAGAYRGLADPVTPASPRTFSAVGREPFVPEVRGPFAPSPREAFTP